VSVWRKVQLPYGQEAEVSDEEIAYEIPDGIVTLHRNKAASRTTEFWRADPIFCALRDIIADEIQEWENAMWEIVASNDIDRAFGASLDKLGRIVNEAREHRTDPAYRVRIIARGVILRSHGRTTDLLHMLTLIDPSAFTITDTPPAAFVVTMADAPTGYASRNEFASLISQCRAAGVGASITIPATGGTFILADTVDATVEGSDVGDSVDETIPLAYIPDMRLA
jgi:hypothetical protein